jgi:phage tail-like protein
VIISDTAANTIFFERLDCPFRYSTASGSAPAARLNAPTGLALDRDLLWVADSNDANVLGFLLPGMELHRILEDGLSQPTAVAVDTSRRVYVLDRALQRVVRFGIDGTKDTGYSPAVTQPVCFALDNRDVLYVSDASNNSILILDPATGGVLQMTLPQLTPAVHPRALAVYEHRLFAADAAGGSILIFDTLTRAYVGDVPGFRGPVAAMAFAPDGDLLIKTDGTEVYTRLTAAAGCIARGTLAIGPLDAGELSDWETVTVSSALPQNVLLETFSLHTESPDPTESQWVLSPSIECLLARQPGCAPKTPDTRRYLWLRITAHSPDGINSPRLTQVQAQTTGTSWLESLPRIYRRDDARERFLERCLALFRSDFEKGEAAWDLMFRRFEPAMAHAGELAPLADSLAFEPPRNSTPQQLRHLLHRVPELYSRRGTIAGLQAFGEIYAGFRPKIIETYRARRVWELGHSSLLGFDTALAAATPEGFVVPHTARTDPRYAGLRGDYYRGTDFDELLLSRTDTTVGFSALSLPSPGAALVSPFTVRWSGQIKPRYSERYLFDLQHSGGARLWIDGQLLVTSWVGADPGDFQVVVVLDATRWHTIQLEIRSLSTQTVAEFGWSSRHQQPEIVPRECLYSVLDEHADLSGSSQQGFDVGNAVVGESRPQAFDEFGAGLCTDYAHLFTVIAPAGRCWRAEDRRALRDVIDAEKPAHTDYHLCFVEPRMRVGFQARLGIDAIVASTPPGGRLGETTLGSSSYLADAPPGGTRVGSVARLGMNTVTE